MKQTGQTYQEVKLKMEHWCAYQDRCSFEASEKLKQFSLSEEECRKLVAELTTHRFLDDKRFAVSFVSGKFHLKNWGRVKIRYHLVKKKVQGHLISEAIDTIDEELYQEVIRKLIFKKSKELKASLNPYQKKAKIFMYLSSKGFETDEIQKCYEMLKSDLI